MPLPPWDLVWPMLLWLFFPTFAASFVLMLLVRWAGGERLGPLAAGLAVVAGVVAGNHFREIFTWQLDTGRPLTAAEFGMALGWALESKPANKDTEYTGDLDGPPPLQPARYWVPWMAGLVLVVELIAGLAFVPAAAGWTARTLAALLAGRLLTPLYLRIEVPWSPWLLA